MEKVYLVIEADRVVDAQVWDDGNLPQDLELVEHTVGMAAWVGWTRVDGEFVSQSAPDTLVTQSPEEIIADLLQRIADLEAAVTAP